MNRNKTNTCQWPWDHVAINLSSFVLWLFSLLLLLLPLQHGTSLAHFVTSGMTKHKEQFKSIFTDKIKWLRLPRQKQWTFATDNFVEDVVKVYVNAYQFRMSVILDILGLQSRLKYSFHQITIFFIILETIPRKQ